MLINEKQYKYDVAFSMTMTKKEKVKLLFSLFSEMAKSEEIKLNPSFWLVGLMFVYSLLFLIFGETNQYVAIVKDILLFLFYGILIAGIPWPMDPPELYRLRLLLKPRTSAVNRHLEAGK